VVQTLCYDYIGLNQDFISTKMTLLGERGNWGSETCRRYLYCSLTPSIMPSRQRYSAITKTKQHATRQRSGQLEQCWSQQVLWVTWSLLGDHTQLHNLNSSYHHHSGHLAGGQKERPGHIAVHCTRRNTWDKKQHTCSTPVVYTDNKDSPWMSSRSSSSMSHLSPVYFVW